MNNCTRCGYDNDKDATRCSNCNEFLYVNNKDENIDILRRIHSREKNLNHSRNNSFFFGTFLIGFVIPLFGFVFIASQGPLLLLVIVIDLLFAITLTLVGKGSKGWSAFMGLLLFGLVFLIVSFF